MFLNMIDALFQNKCYFSFLVDIPLTCFNISINLDYNLSLRYLLISDFDVYMHAFYGRFLLRRDTSF